MYTAHGILHSWHQDLDEFKLFTDEWSKDWGFPVIPKSPSAIKVIEGLQICVRDAQVPSVDQVRNFGVYLDRHPDMSYHISKTLGICHLQMRHLNKSQTFLTRSVKEREVNATIISHISYCNGLSGISENNYRRLQHLQKSAARVIFRLPSRTSATDPFASTGCQFSRGWNLKS